ncbi:MAG TPA: PKD domain-containing protein, partial [bacterium]|nr:PKD domain-containing protein [bacterium]
MWKIKGVARLIFPIVIILVALMNCDLNDLTEPEDNEPPTARAGSDQEVSLGDSVILDASDSFDPNQDVLSYEWTLLSKPAGSQATLNNSKSMIASFVADKRGSYQARVKVSDGYDNDQDETSITANIEVLSNINEDRTLTNVIEDPAEADYAVSGIVNIGATLTIEPGVKIEFGAGARMDVESEGTLVAVGSETDSIIFTGANQASGSWAGIIVKSRNIGNEISYAAIHYGGANNYANIYVNYNGALKLSHSRLDHSSSYGLEAERNAEIRDFNNNSFNGNSYAALNIPAHLIGSLDAHSSYAGHSGNSTISVFSSDVETDQTWPATDAPFVMDGITDLEAVITVQPGAVFKFAQNARLDVEGDNGSLIAIGTPDSIIQFQGTQPIVGHWSGIYIMNTVPTNELSYTKISHGGANSYANVYINYNGAIKITNSEFETSATYGLEAENGSQINAFSQNTFSEDAIVHIPDYLVGALDDQSTYQGDGTGYISVFGSSKNITTIQTWPATDAPYVMDGIIEIMEAVTVAPGAIFKFTTSSRLD